jgi:hypothetical protein
MVEATYVQKEPALLARLAEAAIPWAVDPQSYRFSSEGFLRGPVGRLSYAPDSPLDPSRMSNRVQSMVAKSLEFQAEAEPSMYVVPSLALTRSSQAAFKTYAEIHRVAADMNGRDVPYRPILATAYPSSTFLKDRFGLFERLDRTFVGAYVLPLQLNPKRDSLERLVGYARFLENAQTLGLPAVAGRAGVFGLVLAAFGIENFDSALGDRESFSLSRLDYDRLASSGAKKKGGRQKRVYVRPLRSVLPASEFEALLTLTSIQGQLKCDLGACRFGGLRYAVDNAREHYVHSRASELQLLKDRRTTSTRVQLVNDWLTSAMELGRLVNRLREERGDDPISFEHLGTWRGVLNRVAAPIALSGS